MRYNVTVFVLFVALCVSSLSYGQSRAEEQVKAARECLAEKDYTRSRYFFLQAYRSFAQQNRLDDAVPNGIQACGLYHRENLYNEAFDLLLDIEKKVVQAFPNDEAHVNTLRYPIVKERMQMYVSMNRAPKALAFLKQLGETAAASRNDSLRSDLLYTQAICYYTFGMIPQGDSALRSLIRQYSGLKNYDQVRACYQALINVGRKANSARMVAQAYESFIRWNDSIQAQAAKAEYRTLDQKYKAGQTEITEKDDSLSSKRHVIVVLCIVIVLLIALLVLGGMMLLRFILLSKKQRKEIAAANESNRLKTEFIQNFTSQWEPVLQQLDTQQPAVKALTNYAKHIQELADLECTRSEFYERKEENVAAFCESLMERIRPCVQPDVTLTVNVPRLDIAIHAEMLDRLLSHLLSNAAHHTPAGGKITLDFKKRSAHSVQFIVSNNGEGIPEDQREHLFLPFSRKRDLLQGYGLGLPICALIAQKMDGSLTLDTGYAKGTRFVLELHV